MSKEINLTRGMVAVVDDEWHDYLIQWKWQAVKYGSKEKPRYYAVRTHYIGKIKVRMTMHQLIRFDVPEGMLTDHVDNNSLNNRWDNLRAATISQNNSNRSAKKNGKCKYLGVFVKTTHNKNGTTSVFYVAHTRHNKIPYRLGQYRDPIDAARAYDRKVFELKKEFARLNFPEDYKQKAP